MSKRGELVLPFFPSLKEASPGEDLLLLFLPTGVVGVGAPRTIMAASCTVGTGGSGMGESKGGGGEART